MALSVGDVLVSTLAYGTDASAVVSVPRGAARGDAVIAFVLADGQSSRTVVSSQGLSGAQAVVTGTDVYAVFAGVLGDDADLTFTWGDGRTRTGRSAFVLVFPRAEIVEVSTAGSGSRADIPSPSVTVPADGLAVQVHANYFGARITAPAGFTAIASHGAPPEIYMGAVGRAMTGATGTITSRVTDGGSMPSVAWSIALGEVTSGRPVEGSATVTVVVAASATGAKRAVASATAAVVAAPEGSGSKHGLAAVEVGVTADATATGVKRAGSVASAGTVAATSTSGRKHAFGSATAGVVVGAQASSSSAGSGSASVEVTVGASASGFKRAASGAGTAVLVSSSASGGKLATVSATLPVAVAASAAGSKLAFGTTTAGVVVDAVAVGVQSRTGTGRLRVTVARPRLDVAATVPELAVSVGRARLRSEVLR